MSIWTRTRTAMAATCLAFAAIPGTIVLIHTPGVANADVCASVGRRVSVGGCANIADAVAPYAPPPAYYAPMPYDPPPPPNVSRVCQLQRPVGQRRRMQLAPSPSRPHLW